MIYLDFNTKTRVLKVNAEKIKLCHVETIQDVITIRCEGHFYEVIQSSDDGIKAPILRTPVNLTFIRYRHSE